MRPTSALRSFVLPALCALAGALILTGCGSGERSGGSDLDRIRAAKRIVIGVKADTPPFGVLRGDVRSGFDVDLANAIAQRLGVEATFVTVTSSDRIEQLGNGTVDALVASMTITRSREATVDFSIPYFQDGQALLARKDARLAGYTALADKRVGAVRGSTSLANLKTVAPNAVLVEADDFAALRGLLESGDVEAISSDAIILVGLYRQTREPARYAFAGSTFSTEPYGIAVRRDQSALRTAINHAIQELWEDGTWRSLADTWFGPGTPYAGYAHFSLTPYPL